MLESDRNYALNQQQMQEQIRQFNESLDWDKMSAQQKYAAEWVMQTLANGQMPSEELLEAAGLSAADAQKLMAQATGGSGGTGKPKEYFYDDNGNFFTFENGAYKSVNRNQIKDTDRVSAVDAKAMENQRNAMATGSAATTNALALGMQQALAELRLRQQNGGH